MFVRKAIHYFGRALRETGQAMDRLGLVVAENEIFRETFTRHRQLMTIFDKVCHNNNIIIIIIIIYIYIYIYYLLIFTCIRNH